MKSELVEKCKDIARKKKIVLESQKEALSKPQEVRLDW